MDTETDQEETTEALFAETPAGIVNGETDQAENKHLTIIEGFFSNIVVHFVMSQETFHFQAY